MEALVREQEMQRIVIEEQRRMAELKAPVKPAPVKFAPPGSAAFGEPRQFTAFGEQNKEPKEPKLQDTKVQLEKHVMPVERILAATETKKLYAFCVTGSSESLRLAFRRLKDNPDEEVYY